MSYSQLYAFCQELSPKISRKILFPKAVELSGAKEAIAVRLSGALDPAICRGFFLSAKNSEHPIIKQHGGKHVIVLAKGQNYCWNRFVSVKELMHLFDTDAEATNSADSFETLLTELIPGTLAAKPSVQTVAENKAFWMALGALCPENARLQFEKERAANMTDDFAIALKLRIPKQYVPLLFDPRYLPIIKSITG